MPSPCPTLSRRRWLKRVFMAALASPAVAVLDAFALEPRWVKVKRLRFGTGKSVCRFVHFSDLHFKGNRGPLESLVRRINALSPEFVCFTGDIVEEARHLDAALEILRGLKSPLYGVPGNHDYWSQSDFGAIARAFTATGGAWLQDQSATATGGQVVLWGLAQEPAQLPAANGARNILLMHYPAWADKPSPQRFDAILAGHAHGGQIRLPFVGALVVPYGVGRYDLGRFETAAGPLYVTSGIGWFWLPARFFCRPEMVVVEV